MPLPILLQNSELYVEEQNKIITIKEKTIVLEHSLISISKWEATWHKPYFTLEPKTEEELRDYIRCMTLTSGVEPTDYYGITSEQYQKIVEYMKDSQTATTFHHQEQKKSREIMTNEVIYYLMAEFGIPFDPCQKWHINHLMSLIDVCALKSQPAKKMSNAEMLKQRRSLNAMRRNKYKTHG
jgi:hypothetical protein